VSVSGSGVIPEAIVVRRHLELRGRRHEAWARRILICAIALIPVLALANLFGQRPTRSTAENDAAALDVQVPSHLRSGLLFQGRIRVAAKRDLAAVALVLDPGWLEGMQVNSIEPVPVEEKSVEERLSLAYGRLRAGDTLVVHLQFQVDPTNVGRRAQGVSLTDSGQPVLAVTRTVTVFP
jgi:hypothetical protein